jgi:hypothetical protein
MTEHPNVTARKLPRRLTCQRYGVSSRTISRWESDPDLDFPQPEVINGRKYYDEDALTTWDRKHVRKDDIAA